MAVEPLSLFYLEEAAEYVGVSTATIRRWMNAGRLPGYRMAGTGRLRFLKEDVESLLVPEPIRRGGEFA